MQVSLSKGVAFVTCMSFPKGPLQVNGCPLMFCFCFCKFGPCRQGCEFVKTRGSSMRRANLLHVKNSFVLSLMFRSFAVFLFTFLALSLVENTSGVEGIWSLSDKHHNSGTVCAKESVARMDSGDRAGKKQKTSRNELSQSANNEPPVTRKDFGSNGQDRGRIEPLRCGTRTCFSSSLGAIGRY